MYFEEIGPKIRKARLARKLTQAALAKLTDLSRTTINQIESGACQDIGVKKLLTVLEAVGLDLSVVSRPKKLSKDFLAMACTSANVSYRGKLEKRELVRTLVTGKAPKAKRPQLRVVFDELPAPIFDGMVHQVSSFCSEKRLAKNVSVVAKNLQSQKRAK